MLGKPIRVLMLGWEYPPIITGGLGTACEGLTKALSRHNVEISFVMPSLSGQEQAGHMKIFPATAKIEGLQTFSESKEVLSSESFENVNLKVFRLASALAPYMRPEDYEQARQDNFQSLRNILKNSGHVVGEREATIGAGKYGHDIFEEVQRFALEVLDNFANYEFDVIHAHDWMTYPAAMLLAEATKKPLVVHVHSVEFDRSGEAGNPRILEIERSGLHFADRVIAVSAYTRSIVHAKYAVPFDKIAVVHNGIEARRTERRNLGLGDDDRLIVLFLGRITFQKGPDYFVEAAAKVLTQLPDTLFVMAGTGDMLPKLKARAEELGIEKYFSFPGFLQREQVEEIFSLADLYVMPSVSEPFGISCLEAVSKDTPVIVSKQSGVSEVLSHALKVDFWDVAKLADFIANALEHEELRSDLVDMSRNELDYLNWDYAGGKVFKVYQHLLGH